MLHGVITYTQMVYFPAFSSIFQHLKINECTHFKNSCYSHYSIINWRRSGQSVTASDFGSNGPRFEFGRGRCVESLDKALYSHCPKEKPSH